MLACLCGGTIELFVAAAGTGLAAVLTSIYNRYVRRHKGL
jgi:hypothetical protein